MKTLSRGDVHLWLLPVEPAGIEQMRADGAGLLSPGETQRLDGMKHHLAADRFLLGRVLLRRVLARYLDADPASIVFEYNANGKPELAAPPSLPLSFNLSHSASEIVVAVSGAPALGIDIETLDRADAAYRIAQRFFSAGEIRSLAALDAKAPARALMLWALKESVVKANGDSVWDGLAKISLAIEDNRIDPALPENGDDPNWQLAAGVFLGTCLLAVAVGSSGGRTNPPLVFRTWRLGDDSAEESGFEPEFRT